jgi:HAMP domain-containing protein
LVAGRDSLELGALVDGDAAAIVVARFAVRDIAEQAMDDIGRTGQIAYFVADPERRRFVHHSRSGFDGRRILDLYPELDASRAIESREVVATTPAWDGPDHHVWMSAWPELGMLLGVTRAENISVGSWMWTRRGLILVLVAAAVFSAIVIGRSSSYLAGALHGLSHGVDRYTAGDLAHHLELFGEDEISDLGRELNTMAEHWDRRQLAELIAARYDTLRRVRHLVEEETSDVRSGIEALGQNLDSNAPPPILVRGVGRVLNRLADQLRDVEGRVGAVYVDSDEPRLDPVPLEGFLERTIRDSGALTDGRLEIRTDVEPGLEDPAHPASAHRQRASGDAAGRGIVDRGPHPGPGCLPRRHRHRRGDDAPLSAASPLPALRRGVGVG